MSADIAQLGTLHEPDPVDFDHYPDGGSQPNIPPPEGRYFGQVPVVTTASFGATAEKYLKVTLDPITIVNSPEGNGYRLRFTRFSAKKYANREGSQMIDFLRACGISGRVPGKPLSNTDLVSMVLLTSGRVFQFFLEWEAYSKGTDTTFKIKPRGGEAAIPHDETGQPLTLFKDPIDGSTVYVNGRIRYCISAMNNGHKAL